MSFRLYGPPVSPWWKISFVEDKYRTAFVSAGRTKTGRERKPIETTGSWVVFDKADPWNAPTSISLGRIESYHRTFKEASERIDWLTASGAPGTIPATPLTDAAIAAEHKSPRAGKEE